MVENLVDIFSELCREIIKNEFGMGINDFENKSREQLFNAHVGKLRTKCFDLLLGKHPDRENADPCRTPYGADWNPVILIMDYGGELANCGAEKASIRLTTNLQELQGKNFICLREIYKLIFLLRGSPSLVEEEIQHNFLNTVSEYSLKSNGATVHNEILTLNGNKFLHSRSLSDRDSLNIFETGCQLINNLSNKSLATSEKASNKYLNSRSASRIINRSRSSASSDYSIKLKSFSSSSFLQVASNIYSSDHSLWDNFVEKPVSHKLRRVIPSLEKANYMTNGSGEHIKNKLENFQSEGALVSSQFNSYWTEVYDMGETDTPESEDTCVEKIEDPCVYPILKENCLRPHNYQSCFGRLYITKKKKNKVDMKNSFFQSSATVILALWEQEHKLMFAYDATSNFGLPQLRILELPQYIKDVKFLLVGVWTDTFKYDIESSSFTMKEGTCVEGVTPGTLMHFSKEFLGVGDCYVKLRYHTHLNLKRQMISGSKDCRVIFKVFWMSVFDYLCQHSQYVLKIPSNLGLLEFKNSVRNLYPIISVVAEICKVSSSYNLLPQGGQLLTYLLRSTQRITNKYVASVFFGFLKSCCEIYLLELLQNWMFQGHLDRHHRDFFVEHRPKNPRCKDRLYYLSFYMFHDRIPSFLKGLEDSIFNCGKTVHLLKLIQPESKLCRLLQIRAYPKMNLCLSDKELFEQKKKFEDYAENIKKICGKFTSILSLKLEKISRENLYENYILKVKKDQEAEREMQKKESIQEIRRKREQQNQWLTEQIQTAAREKEQKMQEEERQGKLFIENVKRMTEEKKKLVEEEKRNVKFYYEELMEFVDKRRIEADEWKGRWEQMNKKNASLRNYKSSEEIFFDAKDTINSYIEIDRVSTVNVDNSVDNEGNIVLSEPSTGNTALDVVNSNISDSDLSLCLQDIENENIMDKVLSDLQLQNLINSREEYQKLLESDSKLISVESVKNFTKLRSSSDVSCESDKGGTLEISGTEIKETEVEAADENNSVETKDSTTETSSVKLAESETEAQKNKKKIMGSEYGNHMEIDVTEDLSGCTITFSTETEAQKNKKKVMGYEYGTPTDNEKNTSDATGKTGVETEAQKNKKKIMGCEYGVKSSDSESGPSDKTETCQPETEAQKNKKKVMSSEFGIDCESKGNKLQSVESDVLVRETEAQRNRRKIMACEFGYGKESVSDTLIDYSNAPLTEAQKNKQRMFEIEFGHSKRVNEEKKIEREGKSDESVEIVVAPSDKETSLDENNSESEYVKFQGLEKSTSFTEKTLQIYNKRSHKSDGLKFFTLNDNMMNESVSCNDLPWFNYTEVQILFEQHLRKPIESSYLDLIGNAFADMDITKFTNYVRKSVLIPLKIQEELANEALFNHLLKAENLLSHFNSLRNYFFLNDGEFSRRLTQNIFMTLAKCTEPQQFFKRNTLNEIVYEALNYTIHSNEPNTQNVSFEIVEMPQFLSHSTHDVLTPFDLSYQVKWPLNIILTEKALSKYKLVFHFLLKLKRINWTLNENFSYLTRSYKDKRLNSRVLLNSPHYHRIHIYRHAMGQFMRTLENYVSSCSLQFSWLNFQKDLETAKNLDDLYEKHVKYVKEVLKRCFLTKESHELLNCIHILIELSLKYHFVMKSGKWILHNGSYHHTNFEVLKTTFNDFCNLTKDFLRTLRKKINSHHDLRHHEILIEKFDIILK